MKNILKLEHRQLDSNWANNKDSISHYLQSPTRNALNNATEILDGVGNLSIAEPPPSTEIDQLIYRSMALQNDLFDLLEMLENLSSEDTSGN